LRCVQADIGARWTVGSDKDLFAIVSCRRKDSALVRMQASHRVRLDIRVATNRAERGRGRAKNRRASVLEDDTLLNLTEYAGGLEIDR
jgi:hypothetical protein